jgi:hypothetical protein
MNRTSHLLCAHSGLAFAALVALGAFGVAGWFPPLSPALAAADVGQLFAAHRVRILIGMSILALGSVFYWPFSATIAAQLRRIEGAHPVLASTELASATGSVLAVLIPAYMWLALAFRPGAPGPDTLQALNDLAWISFIAMYPPALIQNVAIGACILGDRQQPRIYPRWLGFLNYATAAVYLVGGVFVPFFRRGPFAWDGLIGFWLVAVAFFGWVILMWWATTKAIRLASADERARVS